MADSLFAYVAALPRACSWSEALTGVFVPHLTWSATTSPIIAIFGTTISPSFCSSQALQAPRTGASRRQAAADRQALRGTKEFNRLRRHRGRNGLSNLIALSIIVTAAATLHAAARPIRSFGAGRRSPEADRRCIRGSDLCARHRRHWPAGDPGARRRHRLCGRRGAVRRSASPESRRCRRVLCGVGAVGGHRHRAPSRRSTDLGAVLSVVINGARRSRDGAADDHVAPQGRDGPLLSSAARCTGSDGCRPRRCCSACWRWRLIFRENEP